MSLIGRWSWGGGDRDAAGITGVVVCIFGENTSMGVSVSGAVVRCETPPAPVGVDDAGDEHENETEHENENAGSGATHVGVARTDGPMESAAVTTFGDIAHGDNFAAVFVYRPERVVAVTVMETHGLAATLVSAQGGSAVPTRDWLGSGSSSHPDVLCRFGTIGPVFSGGEGDGDGCVSPALAPRAARYPLALASVYTSSASSSSFVVVGFVTARESHRTWDTSSDDIEPTQHSEAITSVATVTASGLRLGNGRGPTGGGGAVWLSGVDVVTHNGDDAVFTSWEEGTSSSTTRVGVFAVSSALAVSEAPPATTTTTTATVRVTGGGGGGNSGGGHIVSSSGEVYTYVPMDGVTVTSVAPSFGPERGGTRVTVSTTGGFGFGFVSHVFHACRFGSIVVTSSGPEGGARADGGVVCVAPARSVGVSMLSLGVTRGAACDAGGSISSEARFRHYAS